MHARIFQEQCRLRTFSQPNTQPIQSMSGVRNDTTTVPLNEEIMTVLLFLFRVKSYFFVMNDWHHGPVKILRLVFGFSSHKIVKDVFLQMHARNKWLKINM